MGSIGGRTAGPRRPFSSKGIEHVRAGAADADRLRLLRLVADAPGRHPQRSRTTSSRTPAWVGLDNFRRVLDDPLLWTAVKNTLWFTFLALVFGYPIPLILAVADERAAAAARACTAPSPTCPW